MWQKHNIRFANFDKATLRVIWFRRAPLLVAGPERNRQTMKKPPLV
jgi:hypothetical protein